MKIHERKLKISKDSKQITLPDSRYYQRNGKFYPSITHVLSYYPKGKRFEQWLKQVGFASDYIMKKSAEEGTATHELIEQYLKGGEINFLSPNNKPLYNPEVWKMFLKFTQFWETYKPKLISTEIHLFSDEIKVAGTCDLVCEINGEVWIIDHKTSNNLHTPYELQAAIYGKCYEECFGIRPDRLGILWLKSTKRKFNRDKMQGKGWEIVESPRSYEENIEIFKSVKKLFDLENPTHKPETIEFVTTVKKSF